MYRNDEFYNRLMYIHPEKGAIPAAYLYHALYRELQPRGRNPKDVFSRVDGHTCEFEQKRHQRDLQIRLSID